MKRNYSISNRTMCSSRKFWVRDTFTNKRKEGNVLLNDTLNTVYLRLLGVGHVVKDRSDSESGNPLSPLPGLLFRINSNGYFIFTVLQTG